MSLQEIYDLMDAKRYRQAAYSAVYREYKKLGEYPDEFINGLCPEKDSCIKCRTARMNDPNRQLHLMHKRKLEVIMSRSATTSDIEGRMIMSDKEKIEFYNKWTKQLKDDLSSYYKWRQGYPLKITLKVSV